MKRHKNEKPTWAKLARKPGKASSADLTKALQDLESEKSQLEKRKAETENLTIELALDNLAGNEPSFKDGKSLSEVRAESAEISERLSVMERATGLLEDAIEKAVKREKESRLKEIIDEMAKLTKMREADYKEGLKKLAEAMPYLTSAMEGEAGDPLGFFERLNRIKTTRGWPFPADFNEAFAKVKPKVHASGKFAILRLERQDLEKALRVGEFADTGPRKEVNINNPPRTFIKMTDPSIEKGPFPKDQGLMAGTPEKGDGQFAV